MMTSQDAWQIGSLINGKYEYLVPFGQSTLGAFR
jgi:hypothetical protein